MQYTRTAGGLVLGPSGYIAMIKHKNGNGAWLFPKGHLEEGENDEQAARREIAEETGLFDLEILDDLGSYSRHPICPDGSSDMSTMKEIHMYLFTTYGDTTLVPTLEIEEARWVPLSRVINEVGNPNDKAWFTTVFERVRQAVQRD